MKRTNALLVSLIAGICTFAILLAATPVGAQTDDCAARIQTMLALPGMVAPQSRILLIENASPTCVSAALPQKVVDDSNAQYDELRTQVSEFQKLIQSERQAVDVGANDLPSNLTATGSVAQQSFVAEYFANLQRFSPNPRRIAIDAISHAVKGNLLAEAIVAGTTREQLQDFSKLSFDSLTQLQPGVVADSFFQQLNAIANKDQVKLTWELLQSAATDAVGDENLRNLAGTHSVPFTSDDAKAVVQNVVGLFAIARKQAKDAGERARESEDLEHAIATNLERLTAVSRQLLAQGLSVEQKRESVNISRSVQAIIGAAIQSPLPDRAGVSTILPQLNSGSLMVNGVNVAQVGIQVFNGELQLRSLATDAVNPEEVFDTAASVFHINSEIIANAKRASSAIATGTKVLESVVSGNYLGAASSLLGGTFGGSDDGEMQQLQKMDGELQDLLDGQKQIISNQKQTLEAVANLSVQLERAQQQIENDIVFGYKLTAGLVKDKVAVCQATLDHTDALVLQHATSPMDGTDVQQKYRDCISALTDLVNIPSNDPRVPDVSLMFQMQAAGIPGFENWLKETFDPVKIMVGDNSALVYRLSDASYGFKHLGVKLAAATPVLNPPLPVGHFAVPYNPDEVAWFSDLVVRSLTYYPIIELNIGKGTTVSSNAVLDTFPARELLKQSLVLVNICIAQQSALAGDALLPTVIDGIRNRDPMTIRLVRSDDLLAKNLVRYLVYRHAAMSHISGQDYEQVYDSEDRTTLGSVMPDWLVPYHVLFPAFPASTPPPPAEFLNHIPFALLPPLTVAAANMTDLPPIHDPPFDPAHATSETVLKAGLVYVPMPLPSDFVVQAMEVAPVMAQLERNRRKMIELLVEVGYESAPSDKMMSAITRLSLP